MEELVADTISSIASNDKAMQAFLKLDVNERVTLRRVLQNIAERVKAIAEKLTGAESRALLKDSDNLLTLAKELNKALKDAGENVESQGIQNTGKKYLHNSQKNIDSDSDLTDNEHRNNGGAVYGSQNTELLERREISANGRSRDNSWEQSKNTVCLSEILGVSERIVRANKEFKAGVSGWLATDSNEQRSAGWRFDKGIFRRLSKLKLSEVDTAGRKVPSDIQNEFQSTVFKDKDGRLLSLYNWTEFVFKNFEKGQF